MQKKLIALAVAGMVAAPLAMAQSNVTIYGVMDLGLNQSSSHSGAYSIVDGELVTTKAKSITGLNSGQQAGSRIGFRGTEDLGNGLRAGFVYEFGSLAADVASNNIGNTRQSVLSLSGDFGTVAMGRMNTPQDGMVTRYDAFGQGTAGAAVNIYGHNDRLDNTIAYVSPNFNGFSVVAAYSFNAGGQEVARKSGNARVWAINPNYNNGPISVGLNYHNIKSDVSGSNATKVWDLGGSYDFGAAKVFAMYGSRKQSGSLSSAEVDAFFDALDDAIDLGMATQGLLNATVDAVNSAAGMDNRYWHVGVTVPVSEAGTFKLGYTASSLKAVDAKANQWAIGYDHRLSARTNVYSAFARRGQDFGDVSKFGAVQLGGAYKSQFQVGVRHTF